MNVTHSFRCNSVAIATDYFMDDSFIYPTLIVPFITDIENFPEDYVKEEEHKSKIAATRYSTCGRRPHRGQGTRQFTILLPASVSTGTTGDVPFSIFFQGYLKLLIDTMRKYDCHGRHRPHLSFAPRRSRT